MSYPEQEKLIIGSKIYIPRLDFPGGDYIPDRVGILEAVEDRVIKIKFPSSELLFSMWLHEYQDKWFTQTHYDFMKNWLLSWPDLITGYLHLKRECSPNFLKQIIKDIDGKKWIQIKKL